MKGGAELLGVSYGTLYGRYREVFGYLKHGWNSAAAANSSASASLAGVQTAASSASAATSKSSSAALNAAAAMAAASIAAATAAMKPQAKLKAAVDIADQEAIFDQLKTGKISMKQAGGLLGIDSSVLAYQLAGKVCTII